MPTHYLLPCQCGKKNEVDSSQSGLTVHCTCGAELTVPTMRGLGALERVDAAPSVAVSEAGPSWGAQQALVFLGSTILVVAGLAAFAIWWFRMPEALAVSENYHETNRAAIDQQPPEALIAIWQDFRNGIEQQQAEQMLDAYDHLVAEVMGWEMIFGAIGAVGLLLVIVGLFMRVGQPTKTPTPACAA